MSNAKVATRPLGVSVRTLWLRAWEELELDKLDFYEIIPFSDLGDSRNVAVTSILERVTGKTVWMHITTTNAADDHDYFCQRVGGVLEDLLNAAVTGISLHWGLQFWNGRILPIPLGARFPQERLTTASKNLTWLAEQCPGKSIALENLSTSLARPSAVYLEQWLDIARKHALPLVLDFNNLWNACRNAGESMGPVLTNLSRERIAYSHFGGSFEHNGIWLDGHHQWNTPWNELPPNSDDKTIDSLIESLFPNTPLVFELDANLQNVSACKAELLRFRNYAHHT